jgi:hypothetical protein
MDTNQDMIDAFSNMILGVNLSTSLEQKEKDYIIELLTDQLRTELICAELA